MGYIFRLEVTVLLRTNVSTLCVYVYTELVRTSQITQCPLISKTDRLMLYSDVIPVVGMIGHNAKMRDGC